MAMETAEGQPNEELRRPSTIAKQFSESLFVPILKHQYTCKHIEIAGYHVLFLSITKLHQDNDSTTTTVCRFPVVVVLLSSSSSIVDDEIANLLQL
jgi:hypothetical protein